MEKRKLEKDIQKEICEYLQSQGFFFWKHNAFPRFNTSTQRFHSYPKYTPRGLPDIIILFYGKFISLEVKVPDYWKFTDEQKRMKEKIISNGGAYHLVTSIEQARDVMDFYSKSEISLPEPYEQSLTTSPL